MRVVPVNAAALLLLLVIIPCIVATSPPYFVLQIMTWNSTIVAPGVTIPNLVGPPAVQSLKWGLEDARTFSGVLPSTAIITNVIDDLLYPPFAVGAMIQLAALNYTLVVGNALSDVSYFTGIVGGVYGISQFSGSASATLFSNKFLYPYYSRVVAPYAVQAQVIADALEYFYHKNGRGWSDIAILLTSETYGIGLYNQFNAVVPKNINIKTSQSILTDQKTYDLEFQQIKRSKARIIVCFMFTQWDNVVLQAKKAGLIGPEYVWFGTDALVGIPWHLNTTTGEVREDVSEALRGIQASIITVERSGPLYDSYLNHWNSFDPTLIPGVGAPRIPSDFSTLYYDLGYMTALVIDQVDKMGLLGGRVDPALWTNITRNTEFTGASGPVILNQLGDRISPFTMFNWRPENVSWVPVGFWAGTGNYTQTAPVVWESNTTKDPDLDIRPPISYFSCYDKDKGYDPTGKKIKIEKPDGDDINYIDDTYICDGFIDCKNFSDESYNGCATNYMAVFIAFGVITGLLILMAIGFIIFVIFFGFIVPRKRVRAASPIFLLMVAISGIIGYISIYAWFGKPHVVGCNFQSWLLGLGITCMLAALCSKNVRIWRIFLTPFKKVMISDIDLVILFVVMVIPSLIILGLWTLISTPTAAMEHREGEDHYVCTTGGFTGSPGGYVFFFILVAYEGVLILFGLFLSVGTRNVPGLFNESKLIAISIYNIGFFGIVVIPI